jgi:hypothetical protein
VHGCRLVGEHRPDAGDGDRRGREHVTSGQFGIALVEPFIAAVAQPHRVDAAARMAGPGLARVSAMARWVARRKPATALGLPTIRRCLASTALPSRSTPAAVNGSTARSFGSMRWNSETARSWK